MRQKLIYVYVLSASVFEQSDAVFDSQLLESRFIQHQCYE